jgi:hypothetical protein
MTTETPSEIAELTYDNVRFGEEERNGAGGRSFFEQALDDTFRFRRGDGSVDTKDDFLRGLNDPANTSETLTTEVLQVQILGEQAFVEAQVRFKGRRRGADVEGVFRNLRLFEKRADMWRCVMWFNKRIGSLDSD